MHADRRHAVPGAAPRVLAMNDDADFSRCNTSDYPVWKNLTARGTRACRLCRKVGSSLVANAHHAATAGKSEVAGQLSHGRDLPHAIRLSLPRGDAVKHPDLADTLQRLAQRTAVSKHAWCTRRQPKTHPRRRGTAVFLDAECAWVRRPGFDLAFCLNHMLHSSASGACRRAKLSCSARRRCPRPSARR